MGPTVLNQAQDEVFCDFLEFASLDFCETAYNDSLHQCLTSSRGKTKKKWGPKFIQKSGPKLGFLSFSQVWFISFLLNCIG